MQNIIETRKLTYTCSKYKVYLINVDVTAIVYYMLVNA